MRHFRAVGWKSAALLVALSGTLTGSVALAQGPGGPPPQGPPGGRGPGMRRMTVADIPVRALASGLKLTSAQKEKIAELQKQYQDQRQDLMPGPGGQDGGSPPDPDTMRANMEKMRSLSQETAKNIEAQLTSTQRAALPGLIKDVQMYREAGLPAELVGDLKLTADQKSQIAAITQKARQDMRDKMEAARQSGDFASVREAMQQSRQDTNDSVMAVLTTQQKALVDKFREDNPQPEGGRGFGPPDGGGPGGPPPGGPGGPDGGPGGPPPGGQDGAL